VPYGGSFFLITVPEKVVEIDVKASVHELKRKAEERAREEVALRAERGMRG
jgi:hypothetical protein